MEFEKEETFHKCLQVSQALVLNDAKKKKKYWSPPRVFDKDYFDSHICSCMHSVRLLSKQINKINHKKKKKIDENIKIFL